LIPTQTKNNLLKGDWEALLHAVRELHIFGRRQWRMKADYVLSSPAAVRVQFLAESRQCYSVTRYPISSKRFGYLFLISSLSEILKPSYSNAGVVTQETNE